MRKFTAILLIPFFFAMGSCSTDFEINAEWKDIAVVYGLLNQNDTAQYIRLSKAFLGTESAFVMAQEADSIYYDQADVYLIPNSNGNRINVFPDTFKIIKLEPTTEIDKDTGIFASDYNLLYTTEEQLSYTEYELLINIPGKEAVTSHTNLIDELRVTAPITSPTQKIAFANQDFYMDYKAKLIANVNGYIYGLTVRLNYKEIIDGVTTIKHLDWVRPSIKKAYVQDASQSANEVIWNLSGEEFFWFIGNSLEQNNPATARKFVSLDFMFYSGNEDFSIYADINGPLQGVVQEKPPFTNMDNPAIAIGLFASRYNFSVENKAINDWSIDRLSCSEYTEFLRFANSTGDWDNCQ